MAGIEETGKNIEEATRKALEQLGVTEDEVDVEILEEGAKGFLGIGQAPARVRVTLREGVRTEEKPRPKRAPRPPRERRPAPEKPAPPAEPEAAPEKPSPPRPPRPPRERKPKPAPPEKAPEKAPEPVPAPAGAVGDAPEIARDALQRILDALENGGNAEIKVTGDEEIVLDMVGGDTPRLIGRHGQTINAIQYLVGVVTNKRTQSRVRVVVDAEGYRGRREDALRKQALYLAKQVKESGQEAVLDSLTPNERRIIHTALVDDPDVTTYSEGEEPERHLVISPKK